MRGGGQGGGLWEKGKELRVELTRDFTFKQSNSTFLYVYFSDFKKMEKLQKMFLRDSTFSHEIALGFASPR